MRKNKFNAWDTKQKRMWTAEEMGRDQLTLSPDGRGFVNMSGTDKRLSQFFEHMIPLEWTGLVDKNGVEIYERDIIHWWWGSNGRDWGPPATVEMRTYCSGDYDDRSVMGWWTEDCPVTEDCEIIGNTFENPEMIDEKL